MSEQMQEVIGMAIGRAYEAGANYERSKALGIVQTLIMDAHERLAELEQLRRTQLALRAHGSSSLFRQITQIKTEIKIYEELKGKLDEQA